MEYQEADKVPERVITSVVTRRSTNMLQLMTRLLRRGIGPRLLGKGPRRNGRSRNIQIHIAIDDNCR